MDFGSFCKLNGVESSDTFVALRGCVFPEGEFTPEFTMVLYSTTGSACIEVDSKQFLIRRRCMSVLKIGQKVRVWDVTGDFKCKVLLIGGDLGRELNISNVFLTMFIMDESPVLRVTSAYSEAVSLFFAALEKVMMFDSNPYKKDCLMSLLHAFFYSTGYYVFQSLKFKGNDLYKLGADFPVYEDSLVSRFIKLVEQHSQTHRQLSFYAEMLDYNPKYLSALIKRETGYSGQNLIDQYSVLSAMAKLSYSRKSVKEISNEMDFPSQSDFGKFFKRMTGISPLNYRKSRR